MMTQFDESKMLWSAPPFELCTSNQSLGAVILTKLKSSDPKRLIEVNVENEVQLTVKDIYEQTITVAKNLLRLGVKKEDRVILYSRSNEKITPIAFACYTIGAPVNFFELNLKGDAISYYLKLIDPTVIIFEKLFKSRLFSALDNLQLSNLKCVLSLDSESPSVEESLFKPTGDLENFQTPDIGDLTTLPVYLLFTSGSTSMPKIVMHSHAEVLRGIFIKWWELEPEDIVCSLCDLRWINQPEIMLQPVFFGVKRIFSPKYEADITSDDVMRIVKKYKVTHLEQVPMPFLELLALAAKEKESLRSLKKVIIGGEIVTEKLISYAAEILPWCKVFKYYAMTEHAGLVATDELLDRSDINGGALKNGIVVKIIDENGQPLGPNQKGQVCVKSKYKALGYFNNDKANEEAFTKDGWYKTADLGFMDSHNLLNVITRFKFLLRSGGKIIIPNEVENIVNSYPDVVSTALVGHPNTDQSAEDVGTIFVVLKENATTDDDKLREFIRNHLTDDQLQIVRYFKIISKIPLTQCGKTNKKALKQMVAEASKI